jgi:hypothetical protein
VIEEVISIKTRSSETRILSVIFIDVSDDWHIKPEQLTQENKTQAAWLKEALNCGK